MGIVKCCKAAGHCALVLVAYTVCIALVPAVSIVALPIFAIKAIPTWLKHRTFYAKTLTNGTRAPFGRIAGQDYTRRNGRVTQQDNTQLTEGDRIHLKMGKFLCGGPDAPGKIPSFNTNEDYDWLQKEYDRLPQEKLLDRDLKIVQAFACGLVPVIGPLLLLGTLMSPGGPSQACPGCMDVGNAKPHWSKRRAVEFHLDKALRGRMANEIATNSPLPNPLAAIVAEYYDDREWKNKIAVAVTCSNRQLETFAARIADYA